MNELFEIADEVSVFRDGKYIDTKKSTEVTREEIIHMIVGRELTQMFPKETVPIGDVVVSVKNLGVDGIFHDVSFDLRAGEILGLAGLVGSGRSNLAEALFGVVPATSGTISIEGIEVTIDSPASAMKCGMAFLTEDRKETGCFLPLDIMANMDTAVLSKRHVRFGFVQRKALRNDCEEMRRKLRVKTPSLDEVIQNLSGGNQQKVLIGRWLLTKPKFLILDEPTRGIDVGAKAEIHRLVSKLAGQGVAVLMISSEMPEVLGMSDRVMVMHEGRVTGIVDRKDADQVRIMELASQ
jgi:inositol transport system ATP-binding protein